MEHLREQTLVPKKRISRQEKVMGDVAKTRENIPKHGSFAAPGELNLAKKKRVVKLDDKVTVKTGKKTRQYVKQEKSSRKTKRHDPIINNLVEQGWTVINTSRYQITVVKLPEDQASPQKATPNKKGSENRSEMFDNQVGVSHEKNTLLRRFIKRSQRVIGRFFICGKKEV
ncbi:hypothetical protein LOTGIDRAFT_160667 [Lottia gigantea]|uniref:Uncharacterized protein n=1 Tax=Lottia gigantea TaxID=225164 RepID=V4AF76_LOTGI|nr:hypothetical protein LOTGIDRAFT_160667 [Lottia gigantea]ESO95507.1 hypothetical protein LOTGIDRAFT_160667 [Lottia gigantea]